MQNIINLLPRLRRGDGEECYHEINGRAYKNSVICDFRKKIKGGIAYVPRNQMFNSVSGNCFDFCD